MCNHEIARAVDTTSGEAVCKCFCLRCHTVFAKGLNPGEAAVFEAEFRASNNDQEHKPRGATLSGDSSSNDQTSEAAS